MGKGYRIGRMSEEIRKIAGEMLISGIKDPRLTKRMVSITGVEVTSDGSYATLFISVLETTNEEKSKEEIRSDVIAGLKSAAGLMRNEIGRQMKVRHTPELIFKFDDSMEYGRHIDEIIRNINKSEKGEGDE